MGVLQSNQSELEGFYSKALPGFLEYIQKKTTSVGDVEIATTLDGVKSLPARQELGGVQKTVLVPLSLLSGDGGVAITEAKEAATAANTAATAANSAAETASTAAANANSAAETIEDAKTAATTAASNATSAAAEATTAASTANSAATEALKAKDAVAAATENANTATKNAQTVADTLQAKLDNGDFKGEKGDKGDAFTYADFTTEQIAALQKPATDAAAAVATAITNAEAATEAANTAATNANEAESKRVAAESKRAAAEEARVTAEGKRVEAETARAEAETDRVNAENLRKEAEKARVAAEEARETNTNTAIGNANTAATNANSAATAAKNLPKIQDGYFWVWNGDYGEYMRTTSRATGASPKIEGGTWWTYDDAQSKYVDTGISVSSSYVLPTATAKVLGGVKIGANINVSADGTISAASDYELTKAKVETVLTGEISSHTHNYVTDDSYVHTDNNYTNTEKQKVANAITEHQDLSAYAKAADLTAEADRAKAAEAAKADKAHTHSKSDITDLSLDWADVENKPTEFAPSAHTHKVADISDMPTIPTKTSELTNDSGYLSQNPVYFLNVGILGLTNTSTSDEISAAIGGVDGFNAIANAVSTSAFWVHSESISAYVIVTHSSDTLVFNAKSENYDFYVYITNNNGTFTAEQRAQDMLPYVGEAPTDGNQYVRKDGAWAEVTIPASVTKVSELTNDSGYQTASQVQALINSAVTTAINTAV